MVGRGRRSIKHLVQEHHMCDMCHELMNPTQLKQVTFGTMEKLGSFGGF